MLKTTATAARVDVVFIRKSTGVQDENGQIDNVQTMLKAEGVYVPERYWFVCTVPRAKVQGNTEFKRLMELVEADRVGTVYVESQDRWGTGDVSELFTLLGILADHGTRLYDLRAKKDLTGKDDATQLKTFFDGFKSKKEREDLAFRSLRTRVSIFKESGSWPTGAHPFGYGKRCFTADGQFLWEWHPTRRDRTGNKRTPRGQLFKLVGGRLTLTDEDVNIPAKTKAADSKRGQKHRPAAECLIRRDTHEALMDRKTWELAQEKLAGEQAAAREGRKSFSPRNPAYHLKQLFVCGHCGKPMRGRTEIDGKTRKRTIMYACSSYIQGRCNGHETACGYHRIAHTQAEQLLLDKIKELGLEYETLASAAARTSLRERLERLGHEDEETNKRWQAWVEEGVNAFAGFLVESYGVDYPILPKLRRWSFDLYCGDEVGDMKGVVKGLSDLRAAVADVERAAVEHARRRLAELEAELAAYTRSWVKASDQMQAVMREDMERLEAEILEWKPRTVPLSERLKALHDAEAVRQAERAKLLADWPALDAREKGEAMRRLFHSVTLFWERRYHPASARPTRLRKTDRAGRYSYHLQLGQTRWAFAATDLGGTW